MLNNKRKNNISLELEDLNLKKIKSTVMIPLDSIIITKHIKNAVIKIKPDFNFDNFIICDDKTLPLGRVNIMMDDDLYNTSERPPVDLVKKNNFYSIRNGRHRIVRALILEHSTIEANLV